ncbi:ABC transporter substrate-binding protein [Propionibacteriaceae bacterium Y2011]|uniref:ABC transporter substrate-binding protein n=1 Tax=Microlunatus sp. Y2014 TaxID=3418488 RepID=UPI003B467748
MDRRTFGLSLAALGVAATATACGQPTNPMEGGGSPGTGTESGSGSGGAVEEIVVGSAGFTESVVLAELYAQSLQAAGLTVSTKHRIGSREVYLTALRDGSIHAVPEYTGNLLQFLDEGNPAQTAEDIEAALQEAVGDEIAVLSPSEATDQDVYVVTQMTAETQGIASLADLKKIAADSILGGPAELQERPYGPPGLEAIYGAVFKEFRTYDTPAIKVKDLNDGKIQVATFFTTEAAIIDNDYVMLEDPQLMILPQNVIPLVATAVADNTEAVAAFDAVQQVLTTADLTALNKSVDVDHKSPEDVAKEYLTSKGLV